MDGFAATAAIRRLEREAAGTRSSVRHVPVIAITANALQGDREACIAAGMDDYLSKPFSQQQLYAVVGQWIALPALVQQDAPAPRAHPARPASFVPQRDDDAVPGPRQATPPAPPVPINERALDAIRALNSERGEALVQKVVSAWVDDTPQCLETLRQAVAELDALGVRKAAHSLKSASANVGADSFARLCRQLEQLGRDDTTEGASGILNDMEREFQAVRHSLSAILEKET